MLRIIFIAALLLATISVSAQQKPFEFEGTKRKYLIYLPAAYAANPTASFPVVFHFHGGGMTVVEQMYYSRMNEASERHNFIVVYPSGIKQDWNVGFEMSHQKGTNDVGFVRALLDSLKQNYRIDAKAIFATGLSRGGFFCHRLAAEMPDDFAAIASVGGPLPDSVKFYHRSDKRISVLQVHGTADEVVKYDGKANAYASAPATYLYWLAHNGLAGQKESKKVLDKNKKDNTAVTMQEVKGNGITVSLITVENGGHTWPGSAPFNIGYPLGNTSADIDINEVMWQFFHKNRKR